MRNDTVILFPTETEAALFRERYRASCPVVICGIGSSACAAATAAAIANHHPRRMFLAGIAGRYPKSRSEIGACFLIETEFDAQSGAMHGTLFESLGEISHSCRYPYGTIPRCNANTVCCAAGSPLHITGADLENMEGTAFYAGCGALDVAQFAELRAVSNTVGDPPHLWDIPLAVRNLTDTLEMLLENDQ